jgi:hypothetical protein
LALEQWSTAITFLEQARYAAPNDPLPGLRLVNLHILHRDWKNAVAIAADLANTFPKTSMSSMRWRAHKLAPAMWTGRFRPTSAPTRLPRLPSVLSGYVGSLRSARRFSEARIVLQAALDPDAHNAAVKGDMVRVEADIGGLGAGLAVRRPIEL